MTERTGTCDLCEARGVPIRIVHSAFNAYGETAVCPSCRSSVGDTCVCGHAEDWHDSEEHCRCDGCECRRFNPAEA